jgi:hypothetical protein
VFVIPVVVVVKTYYDIAVLCLDVGTSRRYDCYYNTNRLHWQEFGGPTRRSSSSPDFGAGLALAVSNRGYEQKKKLLDSG